MKIQKRNIPKLRAVALAITALVCGVAAVYLYFFITRMPMKRQDIEKSIADDFIANMIKSAIEEIGSGKSPLI